MGNLILGEIKKILRPKALITMAVIFIVFFILIALFYNINWDNFMELASRQTGNPDLVVYVDTAFGGSDYLYELTAENVDERIAAYNELYRQAIESEGGLDYYYKSVVTVLEYVKVNNLYGQELNIGEVSGRFTSAENFTLTYSTTLVFIITIYAIVTMSGLYADEYRNGTIKNIMIKPITANQLTLAKLIAMCAVLLGLLLTATLIGFLYGLAAYGTVSTVKVLLVFNAKHVFSATFGTYVLLMLISSCISIVSYGLLAFSLGTLFKRKTPAILVSLAVCLGIFSLVLSLINIKRFGFSSALSLSSYFIPDLSLPYKANFFISLGMLIVYNALFYFALFFSTNKRDIA